MSDEKKVLFVVNGQKVDGLGRVDGKPAEKPAGPTEVQALTQQVQELQRQLQEAQAPGQDDGPSRAELQDALKRTADAVLARQNYLNVPRATEASPNGQDLAEAVALGFDELKAELDQARKQYEESLVEGLKQSDELRAQITQLTTQAQSQDTALAERVAEVDTLNAQITELKAQPVSPALPEDALDRLVKVDGIGSKLAQKALDALK